MATGHRCSSSPIPTNAGRRGVSPAAASGGPDSGSRYSWSPSWRHHKGAFHRIVRRLYPLSGIELRPVVDGDRIGGFDAFHTPGHNPGHTVYLHEELDAAMLGDLVWNTATGFVPPPWIDSYDTDRIEASIARIAGKRFEAACMGHGTPLSSGGDRALGALSDGLSAR